MGNGAVGEGDGEFGEEAVDFRVGDEGAGGGGEFAYEIGRAKAAMRGVCVRVAKAVALGVSREGATASIGKLKVATAFGRLGVFRSHAERVVLCVYESLVTLGYMKFRNGGVKRSNGGAGAGGER